MCDVLTKIDKTARAEECLDGVMKFVRALRKCNQTDTFIMEQL